MKTRILGLLLLAAHGSLLTSTLAQVPVTVSRTTVNSGGTVTLPAISGQGVINAATLGGGSSSIASYVASYGTVSPVPAWMTVTSTAGSGTPPSYNWATAPSTPITAILMPTVTLATNAPTVFTNTVSATPIYNNGDHSAGFITQLTQTYLLTIVEDGGAGTSANLPTVTLIGQADPLAGISRKDSSTVLRKLLGFSLVANTNATLTSLAFALSNSSTNGNNFSALALYRDADGQGTFDSGDTLLASTTNAGGFAIFSGLTNAISTNAATWFLAASFQPTNQTRNSFISASLSSQNLVALLAGTNLAVSVSGGSVLGTQYAFLDTTVEEDAAAAAALSSQINASVASATNSLSATYANNLTLATNALASSYAAQLATATNGLGGSTVINSPMKLDWTETILPAAAAGAAGIGAAITLDSLNERPLSKEFQPKPSE